MMPRYVIRLCITSYYNYAEMCPAGRPERLPASASKGSLPGNPGLLARDAQREARPAQRIIGVRDTRMTDGTSNPARHFGREVRRARVAAEMTLADFAGPIAYDPAKISRVERGVRPPAEKFAQLCDKVFPER